MSANISLDAEIPIKGYLFHKGRLKIMVSKLFSQQNNEPQPISSSLFVEISCVVSAGQVGKFF